MHGAHDLARQRAIGGGQIEQADLATAQRQREVEAGRDLCDEQRRARAGADRVPSYRLSTNAGVFGWKYHENRSN